MIHLLQVGPALTLPELKKLSRRLAMTGGYELSLESDLTTEQLRVMAATHLTELAKYPVEDSTRRSNNSYRILKLLVERAELPADSRKEICDALELKN